MDKLEIKVLGKVAKKLFVHIEEALNLKTLGKSEVVVFCDYSQFDIPIGQVFSTIITETGVIIDCPVRLEGVTQQFSYPDSMISHGWKTICKFSFGNVIPAAIGGLPVIYGWISSEKYVIFKNV